MTRYLLDTNVVSNVTKPRPSPLLLAWMQAQVDTDLFISALTLAEIRRGILAKPAGRKRKQLEAWFAGPDGPSALFGARILPFDAAAALCWAELMAGGTAVGRPRGAFDMLIAAVAAVHRCVVVTDNERHFSAVPCFNPMRASARG